MAYTKHHAQWKDYPDLSTPVDRAALEHMESGIAAAATVADNAANDAAAAKVSAASAADEAAAAAADAANSSALVNAPADNAIHAAVSSSASQSGAYLNSTFVLEDPKGRPFQKSVPPALTAYPGQRRPHHRVMFQDGETLYAVAQHGQYAVLVSTDFGQTWTKKGTLPAGASALVKVQATGTLLAVDGTNYTSISNPSIRRSTDDGATWTAITTIKVPTLALNGIVEAADGSLIVAEYGNVAAEVYRVHRSTDDGLTWSVVLSSPGGDPAADPGHFHSVAIDPYSGKLIAFMDRANPEVHVSSDNGATWGLLGTSTATNHPNWVQPMFFPEHIVWGTDNQSNGRICRITYADFYAGNFDAAEVITLVNRKANYYTFPLKSDVWLMTQSTEVIAPGSEPDGPGSYYSEVYVVTDEGATVASSLEQISNSAKVGTLAGVRAMLPAFHYSTITDDSQNGRTWVSVNRFHAGTVPAFDALPVTVGFGAPKVPVAPAPLVPAATRQWYASWWYGPEGRAAGVNAGVPDGRLLMVPLWVPHAVKIDKIACEVTSSHVSATFTLCVYNSDQFDHPVNRIVLTDPQSAATSGVKEVFITATELPPGLYWLGVAPSGGSIGFRTVGNGHLLGMPTTGFAPGGTGATNEANCFYMDGAGTPPATMTNRAVTTNGIKIMVRATA